MAIKMAPRRRPQGSSRAREGVGINRPPRFSMRNLGAIDKKIMAFFAFAAVLWLIAPSLQAALPARYATSNSSSPLGHLKFRKDGTFHISIFEDLHFGESEYSKYNPKNFFSSFSFLNSDQG